MGEQLEAILSELRAGYDRLYGDRLARMILFGSQARGDARPGSDVDVMVILRGAVDANQEGKRTDDFIASVCLKHDALVTPVYISEKRYREEDSPLMLNVRREGVAI
jgi:predicted nucleotidyltransferase